MSPLVEVPERLSYEQGLNSVGHSLRYCIAKGLLHSKDLILDAACGSGYGAAILGHKGYLGVDKTLAGVPEEIKARWKFLERDLETWISDQPFDVFLGFETLEHLDDPSAYLINAFAVRRLVILSTPVIPTVGVNPHHRQDYTKRLVDDLITRPGWVTTYLDHPDEQAGIWISWRTK